MPTSARPAALHRHAETAAPSAGRAAARPHARPHARPRGFTLIELLIALAIVAMAAAVALPSLVRRLDAAFSDADLQQAQTSAQVLPARVATLGIDVRLDKAALSQALPDGALPLDIPRGWDISIEVAPQLTRSGSCEAGSWRLREPLGGRRWRFAIARLTCEVSVLELGEFDR
jgi:prepilin-type N-terminal cleavage/methylation domain-containing protein